MKQSFRVSRPVQKSPQCRLKIPQPRRGGVYPHRLHPGGGADRCSGGKTCTTRKNQTKTTHNRNERLARSGRIPVVPAHCGIAGLTGVCCGRFLSRWQGRPGRMSTLTPTAATDQTSNRQSQPALSTPPGTSPAPPGRSLPRRDAQQAHARAHRSPSVPARQKHQMAGVFTRDFDLLACDTGRCCSTGRRCGAAKQSHAAERPGPQAARPKIVCKIWPERIETAFSRSTAAFGEIFSPEIPRLDVKYLILVLCNTCQNGFGGIK
jgi:hypothetical protein